MKVTYDWLKNYSDFDIEPDKLVHTLTMLGLEVDSIDSECWDFSGIVVGEVLQKEKHPNADKLSLCKVKIGSETLNIICGAPNVEAGQKVPVATPGTQMPNGMFIKNAKIRGVESQGMICSESELGLSGKSDGIMVLDQDIDTGKPLLEVIGHKEITIDVDVTPNRPDCFGAIGIAREIATVADTKLKKPVLTISESSTPIDSLFQVIIEDAKKCPRFTARYIENVEIKPSPWWLVKKLEAVGVRSINNIVDVTNFVMMETGHPLHAYDYDLLAGQKIIVKCAEKGETFITLDGAMNTLNDECLMICDAEKAVGVAGIMGGQNTEVSENTRNILLECAYFDPRNIRRTSKFLEKSTEASKRFERGVDPNGLTFALNRAAQLISELGNGEIAKGIIDVYPKKIEPVTIALHPKEVERILGVSISVESIVDILQRLGFTVAEGDVLQIHVPTFRPDVTREADLIEEIARIHGYDNFPTDCTAFIDQLQAANEAEILRKKIIFSLQSFDFSEITTYNLISKKEAQLFLKNGIVELINPLSEELSVLRTSLLPGLLKTARWNINRKIKNLKLFEIGSVFSKNLKTVSEHVKLCGILTGLKSDVNWRDKGENVDIFDVKGTVEQLFHRNNLENYHFSRIGDHPILNKSKSLSVSFGGTLAGVFGAIRQPILEEFDIGEEMYYFDIDYKMLIDQIQLKKSFKPIPKFPSISRDIALIIDRKIDTVDIEAEIKKNGGTYLQQIEVFDLYIGDQISKSKKSIAFKLTFLSYERTLTEEEIDKTIHLILSVLSQKYSCTLRS